MNKESSKPVYRNNISEIGIKNHKKALRIDLFKDGSTRALTISESIRLNEMVLQDPPLDRTHKSSVFIDTLKLVNYLDIKLCIDAERSLEIENAGGNSEYSEALSITYFDQIFNAKKFLLEMEVEYTFCGKMVDYICSVGDGRVGVSVTRAMGYPHPNMFTKEDARNLLKNKLYGLIVACDCVVEKQNFSRSVLHIWCQNNIIAEIIKEVYAEFDIYNFGLDVQCDITVLLTICDEHEIYTSKPKYKGLIYNRACGCYLCHI